jgi:asparagine synthase (glutamine-hydrolysing)
MCGIAGTWRWDSFNLEGALDRIAHRGPDARGVLQDGDCRHGHVRLSIVDLTAASNQPFSTADGALLSFNGEIWNWRQVRRELEIYHQRLFVTQGDTEVLAQALEVWGLDQALRRLEGMFAFCWSKDGRAYLVRDRFGKIPLYVHRAGEAFAWASERKGLGVLPAAALPAGSVLELDSGRVWSWYVTGQVGEPHNSSVRQLVDDGVVARLQADAPVCALISGGLDSALILTLAKAHKPDVVAFCAAVEGHPSADLDHAQALCRELAVPLEVVKIREPGAEALAAAARTIEIPMKAQVEIAALCVPLAAAVRSAGFKVCLSGEGADELFGGYGSMCIKGSGADDAGWRDIRLEQVRKMARGNFVRCNKAFMAAGVECRLPFLERRLVETVLAMGKIDCPPGKGLLKSEAEAAGVPRSITRRQKETFQGGAGVDGLAANALGNPAAFYRAEVLTAYGASAVMQGAG